MCQVACRSVFVAAYRERLNFANKTTWYVGLWVDDKKVCHSRTVKVGLVGIVNSTSNEQQQKRSMYESTKMQMMLHALTSPSSAAAPVVAKERGSAFALVVANRARERMLIRATRTFMVLVNFILRKVSLLRIEKASGGEKREEITSYSTRDYGKKSR